MKFIRVSRVCEITGVPRSSLYKLISEGSFPKQIKIGEKSVAWLEEDVLGWIKSKLV